MPIKSIRDIIVGERFRKDMGDLQPLATSIIEQGLLSPPGIDENNKLVFGQRRLLACRDVLGWTEIEVRVVDVTSIVEGEFAENEIRKQFTDSERVAIAEAVMERKRQGKPTDELHGARREDEKMRQTEDLAAKAAGFGSARSMRRVKAIHDSGDQALIKAVDEKRMSPTRAEEILKDKPRSRVRERQEKKKMAGLLKIVKDLPPGKPSPRDSVKPPSKPTKPIYVDVYLNRLIGMVRNLIQNERHFPAVVAERESLSIGMRRDAAEVLRSFANDFLHLADALDTDTENGREIVDITGN